MDVTSTFRLEPETFKKALATLENALVVIKDPALPYMVRCDSLIKRFGYTSYLFGEILRERIAQAIDKSIEIPNHCAVYTRAFDCKLITLQEYEDCTKMLMDRNLIAYGYIDEITQELVGLIPTHYKCMQSIFTRIFSHDEMIARPIQRSL